MMFRMIRKFFSKVRELFDHSCDRLAEVDMMLLEAGCPVFGDAFCEAACV